MYDIRRLMTARENLSEHMGILMFASRGKHSFIPFLQVLKEVGMDKLWIY